MAMTLEDVIILAKAGYGKSDIAAFMNLGNPQTTPPSPVQVPQPPAAPMAPVTAPTPAPAPAQQAPATPDLGQLTTLLSDLTKKVDAMQTPTAGTVGALPTVTSVEDIIRASIQPASAPESPDFTKGVNLNG